MKAITSTAAIAGTNRTYIISLLFRRNLKSKLQRGPEAGPIITTRFTSVKLCQYQLQNKTGHAPHPMMTCGAYHLAASKTAARETGSRKQTCAERSQRRRLRNR